MKIVRAVAPTAKISEKGCRAIVNPRPEDYLVKESAALMKSKRRVQQHGEVFTPQWVIDRMIAIPGIEEKARSVFATFLEPSAGEGAFLLAILDMKLRSVTDNYGGDKWGQYALWALSSIYGIELLEDNLALARENMLELFTEHFEMVHGVQIPEQADLYRSAQTIIWANVVQGDTLTYRNLRGQPIIFSHWNRVSSALHRVRRVPFTYSSLFAEATREGGSTQLSLFQTNQQQSLFSLPKDKEDEPPLERYAIVDIDQVWKEAQEDDG